MLAPLAACTTPVPATITQHPLTAIDRTAPIYVVTPADRDRIARSLSDAGLEPSDFPSVDGYAIEVQLGNVRTSRDCGALRNVIYRVAKAGATIMVVKARGFTGTCDPNVYDDMSRKVASLAR